MSQRAQKVIARCREIATCTEIPGETTRTFLAPSMKRVHELFGGWMHAAGMSVRVDAAGNLRGFLPANTESAPLLMIGSHLDTVANAGAFDGILGVILGLALTEELGARKLPFAVEVVGFSEEEGVRFAKPFLGSLALTGDLDATVLARTDADCLSVADAIRAFGLDPRKITNAVLDAATFVYLEFHIEQGPVLESEHRALAVVDAVAGQTRMQLRFTGRANHAGTTPMGPLRQDALAAAAEWICEVERYATQIPGLVATVGKIEVPSAAGNVVPGMCIATLDVRHAKDEIRREAVQHLSEFAAASAAHRGVQLQHTTTLDQAAVAMDAELVKLLQAAATRAAGEAACTMTSGAGHDAMILARKVPSAIVFLRTPGGLSHHPDESVLEEDVDTALSAGLEFLTLLGDDREMLYRLVSNARAYKGSAR